MHQVPCEGDVVVCVRTAVQNKPAWRVLRTVLHTEHAVPRAGVAAAAVGRARPEI